MATLTLYERHSPDDYHHAIAALVAKGYSQDEAVALVAKKFPQLVRITKGQKEHAMSSQYAYDQIEALAAELVKKGKAKTLEQAIDQVVCAQPELYVQYKAEPLPELEPEPARPPRQFDKSAPQHTLENIARRYVEDGKAPTFEQAFVLALSDRPDLHKDAYAAEAERNQNRRSRRKFFHA